MLQRDFALIPGFCRCLSSSGCLVPRTKTSNTPILQTCGNAEIQRFRMVQEGLSHPELAPKKCIQPFFWLSLLPSARVVLPNKKHHHHAGQCDHGSLWTDGLFVQQLVVGASSTRGHLEWPRPGDPGTTRCHRWNRRKRWIPTGGSTHGVGCYGTRGH